MSPAPHRKGCCNEFTRAELARRSLAEAGKGLPSIERGMPAPAGTGLSRRSFLLRTGGLALSVYGASLLSPRAFVDGIAEAASSQGKVLVSVFLEGGIDALSVLSPVDDDDYRRLRPTLRLPPGAGPTWSEDDRLQWHPSAAPLHQLHGEGKVTVFPGIGYANADQSHFTSRHYWEVGELEPGRQHRLARPAARRRRQRRQPASGPLPRRLARAQPRHRAGPGRGDLGGELRPLGARRLGRCRGADVRELRAARCRGRAVPRRAAAGRRQGGPAGEHPARPARRLLGRDREPGSLPRRASTSPRASPGWRRCSRPGCRSRCASVGAPGSYDTHDEQADDFGTDLQQTCDGLLAFQRDLEARGLDDRVVTLVWSEFGRRPEENGEVRRHRSRRRRQRLSDRQPRRGTMVGEWPGLTMLDEDDNLRSTAISGPSTARCSSSGSASTRRRSSPAPRASPGRR